MIFSMGNLKMKLSEPRNDDEVFSSCIVAYWISSIANAVVKRILGGEVVGVILSALICILPFALITIKAMLILYARRKLVRMVLPSVILLAMLFMSYLRDVPVIPMISVMIWGALGFTLSAVMISIENYRLVYEEFKKKICLIIILSLPAIVLAKMEGTYFMHFSFMLVMPMAVCLRAFLDDKEKRCLFEFAILCSIVVICGARGPLVCIAIFGIAYTVFKSRNRVAKILLCITTFVCFFNYRAILMFLYEFLAARGIESRTLWILVYEPTHSSGRDILYAQAKELIEKKPWLGWGVLGERIHMEVYPHNIYYEFMLDFGKPLGYALLIAVVIIILSGLLNCKGELAFFYLVLLSTCVALLWSGSYLSSPEFWMLLFVSACSIRKPVKGLNVVKRKQEYE